jgi:hypothetical protein
MRLTLALLLLAACSAPAPPPADAPESRGAAVPATDTVRLEEPPPTGDRVPVSRPEIAIEIPRAGETVRSNPIHVRGTARTFENNVVVRLRDTAGRLIVETFTTSRGDSGQHNVFEADLFATRDPGRSITIEALEYSAKDGSERSLVRVTAPFDVELVPLTVYAHDPARAPNDCSQTFPRVVKVPKSISSARLAAEVLLTSELFPRGSRLESINLRNGVLTADFNERLRNVGGSCRAQALRAGISRTLGTLPGVREVVITAGGSRELALQP